MPRACFRFPGVQLGPAARFDRLFGFVKSLKGEVRGGQKQMEGGKMGKADGCREVR